MYLCRSLTSASLPDIANVFSKTHATVLHAYRSVDSRMEVDADLRRSVSDLARRLGRPLSTHADA
jgi:chromosomal replication initiation ATPase DnaA